MKYLRDYRNPRAARAILTKIEQMVTRPVQLMEVCGTHTMSIFRYGIKKVLPASINLLSGPGCPVCVTPQRLIDQAVQLARNPRVILTTFGDMLRVPGSSSSLAKEKAAGADVRLVYSPMDALKIAFQNPERETVFFAIGFETTSPTIAVAVVAAKNRGIKNFSLLGAHKLIPNAMKTLLNYDDVRIDGFICPGHVSSIIGAKPYEFLAVEYHTPSVVVGFEPLDILQGILMLVEQVEKGEARVEIQYKRGVPYAGNPHARRILEEVFEVGDAEWRGIGIIPGTGLKLKGKYAEFDVLRKVKIGPVESRIIPGCLCGEVLRGAKIPLDCALFGKACTPENPVGACMVSSEGTCAAYYKYAEEDRSGKYA